MKIAREIIIKISLGLHARPAMELVRILQNSSVQAKITFDGKTIDARSIISLLSLAAPCGAVIKIALEGIDAKDVLKKLTALLSKAD